MQYVTSRNILLMLTVAALIGSAQQSVLAGNVHWLSDYAQARTTATAQSKPMLMMFTASWCGPCKKMKSTTLSDAAVESVIEENFIPVMIDTDANPAITRKFGVSAMPTVMVVHPVTEKADKVRGFQGRGEFLSFLNRNKQDLQLASATKVAEMPATNATPAGHQTVASSDLLTPYCLVTIVEEGKLVAGNPAFAAQFEGMTVNFSSISKRDQFIQNPTAFFPEFKGLCPVVWKETGKQVRGEARWAVEYDNHLFFCQSRENAQQFLKDPTRYSQAEIKVSLQSGKANSVGVK